MRKKKQEATEQGGAPRSAGKKRIDAPPSAGKKRIGATVSGSVQGVGFRYFTQFEADRFNLTGWVRNAGDGSVELEAQGLRSDVDGFLGQLAEGPPLSYVSDVRSYEMPLVEGESRFEIRF